MCLYFMEVCIFKAPLSLFEGRTLFHFYVIDLVTHTDISVKQILNAGNNSNINLWILMLTTISVPPSEFLQGILLLESSLYCGSHNF